MGHQSCSLFVQLCNQPTFNVTGPSGIINDNSASFGFVANGGAHKSVACLQAHPFKACDVICGCAHGKGGAIGSYVLLIVNLVQLSSAQI
jgi:hypothetical protein